MDADRPLCNQVDPGPATFEKWRPARARPHGPALNQLKLAMDAHSKPASAQVAYRRGTRLSRDQDPGASEGQIGVHAVVLADVRDRLRPFGDIAPSA